MLKSQHKFKLKFHIFKEPDSQTINYDFFRWGVYQYDPEEEHPRPEYLAQLETVDNKTINFVTKTTEPKPPFWKMKVPRFLFSWTVLAVLVVIALISVVGVILYRYILYFRLEDFQFRMTKYLSYD